MIQRFYVMKLLQLREKVYIDHITMFRLEYFLTPDEGHDRTYQFHQVTRGSTGALG